MATQLDNKVVLIIGGAKNLGAEIALLLAPLGAHLALHYNSAKTKKDADELSATLKTKHPDTKVAFYQADLRTGAGVNSVFQSAVKGFGKIDVVINTAGMVLKKPMLEISESEYDEMFA